MTHQTWGYHGASVGPDKWSTLFPNALGKKQSPIDIQTRPNGHVKKAGCNLVMNYNNSNVTNVVNNGHTVTFGIPGTTSVISGEPLKHEYRLLQFHFHWGSNDSQGSEHTVEGEQYSAEIHLVHLNTKYSSLNEALEYEDGLAVVGALLEVGEEENPAYDEITEFLKEVQYKDDKFEIKSKVDIPSLLPEDKTTCCHYEGSLTTPPLSECVQWINLLEPVKISERNIAAFRQLKDHKQGETGGYISDNFRPVQPIGDRIQYLCCQN